MAEDETPSDFVRLDALFEDLHRDVARLAAQQATLDRLQRISDQRNRLIGTYAPLTTRVEVIPAEVVERMIAENERLIAQAEKELGLSPGQSVIDVMAVKSPRPDMSLR